MSDDRALFHPLSLVTLSSKIFSHTTPNHGWQLSVLLKYIIDVNTGVPKKILFTALVSFCGISQSTIWNDTFNMKVHNKSAISVQNELSILLHDHCGS